MILAACAVVGIVLGIIFPFTVPQEYSQYIAIIILALLDSIMGGISSMARKCFDMNVFLSGFLGNSVLALALTFLGKKLDADLFFVGMIVFGTRMFNNFSVIRRHYLSKIQIKFKK